MAALVAANVSNAVDPRQGLTGAVDLVGAPTLDTETAGLHHAFATWLRSGRSATPSVVDERVDGRLAWQRPKALICLVLLLVIVLVSARIWRTLVRRSRRRTKGWGWGRSCPPGRRARCWSSCAGPDGHGHRQHPGVARSDLADPLLRLKVAVDLGVDVEVVLRGGPEAFEDHVDADGELPAGDG